MPLRVTAAQVTKGTLQRHADVLVGCRIMAAIHVVPAGWVGDLEKREQNSRGCEPRLCFAACGGEQCRPKLPGLDDAGRPDERRSDKGSLPDSLPPGAVFETYLLDPNAQVNVIIHLTVLK